MKYLTKISKLWKKLRFQRFKGYKILKELQSTKRKRAIDYVDQLLKVYDKETNNTNKVGEKMGCTLNSIHLYALQVKLVTGQQYVTDELLAELEKLLWEKT